MVILNIEESGNIPIVHTFINNAEIIPDDFIVSPSPPKIVNQQPNIPIIANAPTIDDEDFSPPIDSSNHIQYNPPVFSSSPTHYNYSYDNEKPSSPVTYHDYKPTSEYYSIPPPPISDDNSPEPKQQQQQQQYIHSPRPENHLLDLQKQQQEREKEKKQQEIITERKRLEYQRLQQKRQVIQQQQQIQLMKLKEKHQQIQQQQQQQSDYQQQLQLEREKYLKIQQKIEAMKQQQHNQQPHPSQQYQQPPPQQQYQQQPPQQQYQQKQIQQQYQQRQPLIAKLESPKRNVKNAFESIHISSPSNHINHNSIIKEETSPIISPHKPKINLPVFDIDLDLHAKVNNNEENNENEIMSPLFKEEKQTNKEEEEEEDLPLWAKVASKKNTEKLPNQQNINETNNNNIHRRRQWNDEISKDIQKRREKYPPKQPDPPTLFAVKPTSLLIKWNENKNDKRKKYYKTDSYMLQYQIYPDGIWKNVGIGVIHNLNYTFDNLKSGYNYRFRIKSHNSEGWSIFSNCSEIYTVPGEKKKEDNNNNNKRIEMKIGNRREFSSIRKSSIDEDLKRKEIAERRNIYLYNGKYPKYSDKINKKRSVSEIVYYILIYNCFYLFFM